ncbi:putative molybdenum-pterin-binding protein [Candidatus Filomicrobium marinum]|uniref:Molybdenum-pterin binding domain-containing protein n=2 Tax=Filomicrobium TaxID=119044 RepID=A0A1H0QP00_9HYPH|nr:MULTISPECIES: TOBE domain-containing protein [Filomicrobium]MCV0369569.1 TOBE domain-containing protein [Filomicrobium sp.]CFX45277.1 putative molybdenum-pterin-binding protein [Candidatus Filomicrobium marinum]CPR20778.1 putative molybdenum-pterin-binding protein [Candidatus Filomicrobium marinum]SDP19101.1 molybdenum-pterin binding domain-containing protein [Filomicrobium insigne]
MKLSARNVLSGTVTEIKKGAVAAQVKIDVGGGNTITSTVTVDAVEDLGLAPGKPVKAVIKASEVILGIDS